MDIEVKELEALLGPRRTAGTLAADLLTQQRVQDMNAKAILVGMSQKECVSVLGIFANAINQVFQMYHEEVIAHLTCHRCQPEDLPSEEDGYTLLIEQIVSHADACDAKRSSHEG